MIWRLIVHLLFPGGRRETQEAAVNMPTEEQARRHAVEAMVPPRFPGAVVEKIEAEQKPEWEHRSFFGQRY